MPKKKLPDGWMIEDHYCWDEGTGMGDDMYDPALFRWQLVRRGHLWWKKTYYTWVLFKVLRFAHSSDAHKILIDIAWTQLNAEAKEVA